MKNFKCIESDFKERGFASITNDPLYKLCVKYNAILDYGTSDVCVYIQNASRKLKKEIEKLYKNDKHDTCVQWEKYSNHELVIY